MDYLERNILRTPFAVVNSSSIIRQGCLEAGLFATQAKRTEAFMRMAGLSDIEKKRQQLADAKAAVTIPMLSFSIDDTAVKIKELKDYLQTMWDEKQALPVVDEVKLEACRSFLSTIEQVNKARQELAEVDSGVADINAAIDDSKKLLAARKAELQKLTQQEEIAAPEAEKARLRISMVDKAKRDWERKVSLQLSLEEQEQKLAKLVDPGEYTGGSPDDLKDAITEINVNLASAKKTLSAFMEPKAACPTCRRPCSEDESKLIADKARAEIAELELLLKEATSSHAAEVALKKTWLAATQLYASSMSSITATIKAQKESLASLADVTQPVSDEKDHKTVVYYAELCAQLKEALKNEREASDILKEATTQLSVSAARIEELRKRVVDPSGDSSMTITSARLYVDESKRITGRFEELKGIISTTESRLKDEQGRLDKLKEDSARAKVLTEYSEYLEFARSALHRDNFPSGKVKEFVDRMLMSANAYLDAMQAGFSVSYHKEDGFIAFFPSEQKYMRADRLSGGERITFALAFRFAVNDIHTDTGFLILDEPTVWLDDKHIDYVINALSLVKAKIVPRVQIIIVTHDEKLAAVADYVYEVGSSK